MTVSVFRGWVLEILHWYGRRQFERSFRRAKPFDVGGIRVFDIHDGEGQDAAAAEARRITSLRSALKLIRDSQPTCFRWLTQGHRIVCVQDLPGGVAHSPTLAAMLVESEFAETKSAEVVGAYLVHEAVRSRLWRSTRDQRVFRSVRTEVRCARAMLEFINSVPSASYLIQWAEETLRRSKDPAIAQAAHRVFDLERWENMAGAGIRGRLSRFMRSLVE